ncbi:MAG: SDR family NAD(P)-dependent oxidoreductase [Armatimonadota bacterium]
MQRHHSCPREEPCWSPAHRWAWAAPPPICWRSAAGTSSAPAATPEHYHAEQFAMLPLDVTDEDSVEECIGEIMHRVGRLDGLVNNAGYGLLGMVEEPTVEEARRQLEVNYFGGHRMCRAVLPIMREQGAGHIVNVSSLSGIIGTPPSGHYVASKHALEGYTDVLKYEVEQFGIRVALVEPGYTRSRFRENVARPAEPIAAYDELRERLNARREMTEGRAAPSRAVARTIARVLNARRPRLRYTCTRGDWMIAHLRCWLPEATIRWLVRRVFGV